jgi:hypothetical protein
VHFLGAFFKEISCIASEELAKCTGSIPFTSLLYSMLDTLHIYINISQTSFPQGGFVHDHVDQKLHLFIFHVCLVVYQH